MIQDRKTTLNYRNSQNQREFDMQIFDEIQSNNKDVKMRELVKDLEEAEREIRFGQVSPVFADVDKAIKFLNRKEPGD